MIIELVILTTLIVIVTFFGLHTYFEYTDLINDLKGESK